jgi:hypothetical protein
VSTPPPHPGPVVVPLAGVLALWHSDAPESDAAGPGAQ